MENKNTRRDYMREYGREYYKIPENREKRLKKEREATKKNRAEYEAWKKTLSCQYCGETEPCCLEMHHIDPREKEFSIAKGSNKRLKRILKEAEKCICLCSNCHKKFHKGLISLVGLRQFNGEIILPSKQK